MSFHSRIFGYQAIQRKLSLAVTAQTVDSRIFKPLVNPVSNIGILTRDGSLSREKFLKPPCDLGRLHGRAAELLKASRHDPRMYHVRPLRSEGIPYRLSKTVEIVN